MTITAKERVMAALNHIETDRVPLDIGGINNTAMHWMIEKMIKERLNLADHGYLIKSRGQLITVPDQSIIDYFGVDTCSIYINETREWIENADGTFTDMWGLGQKLNPDGYYYNMCKHPMENIEEIEDLDSYQFPEPTAYMLEGLSERLDANKDKCCILEGLREPMFGLPSWLRRNDNFYVDLMINEDFCDAFHEKILAYYKNLIDFIMTRIGDRIDIVKFADDMGAQNALLMSPETYRARVKPYQAALYGYVKEKYKKKILLHSCGAIRPIIGDLIEIGVDALNPVQISAENMDPESLKREFGDKITFWGGGIDTQQVLGVATPDVVREHVRRNMAIFKPHGGYVFSQVHNILPNVPIENILAMYDAYQEMANY
jgi:uroporphyrinogen decarboxylase